MSLFFIIVTFIVNVRLSTIYHLNTSIIIGIIFTLLLDSFLELIFRHYIGFHISLRLYYISSLYILRASYLRFSFRDYYFYYLLRHYYFRLIYITNNIIIITSHFIRLHYYQIIHYYIVYRHYISCFYIIIILITLFFSSLHALHYADYILILLYYSDISDYYIRVITNITIHYFSISIIDAFSLFTIMPFRHCRHLFSSRSRAYAARRCLLMIRAMTRAL